MLSLTIEGTSQYISQDLTFSGGYPGNRKKPRANLASDQPPLTLVFSPFRRRQLRVEFLPNQAFSIVSTPVVEIPRERFFPIDFSSIANSPHVDTWDIYISPNPSPRSLFTVHKTTHRAEYDAARAFLPSLNQHRVTTTTSRHHADSAAKDKDPVNMPHSPPDPAPPPPPRLVGEEILLVTNDEWGEQLIMEGSITTPYFWRHERWVTPDAGGHAGTTRRYALEKGLCVTDRLSVVSVQEGETLLLSNGVIGWVRGRVVKLGDKWIKKEEGEGLL